MLKGIDISAWQTKVDYKKLKEDGIEFAIIRLGYGKNKSGKDKYFEKHYKGLKEVGIKVGCYLYSYCNKVENAKLEAKNTLEIIQGKEFELPVFYDLEDEEVRSLGKINITKIAIDYCQEIEKAGFKAGIYASLFWFRQYIDLNKVNQYKIWVAEWNGKSKCSANFNVDYWQYTSKGKVKGIEGNVDLDYCYEKLTSENKTTKEGEFNMSKKWKNGKTVECVYSDTDLYHVIGSLNPYEECECLDIVKNRYLVKYKVDNSTTYKCGFVKYSGGVK